MAQVMLYNTMKMTPEQKLAQHAPSRFARAIPSDAWKAFREANPKPPSKRDIHRMTVKMGR